MRRSKRKSSKSLSMDAVSWAEGSYRHQNKELRLFNFPKGVTVPASFLASNLRLPLKIRIENIVRFSVDLSKQSLFYGSIKSYYGSDPIRYLNLTAIILRLLKNPTGNSFDRPDIPGYI